ncbi:MAG: GNAT family N-acetyltransferase [Luminiphilus sp.]|nr:GNAT family N-acetyltransferase [Luminiphilus sp.]
MNLETDAFSFEQTTSSDFDPLYEVARNPVVWEQHPEKNRWRRLIFSAFFRGAMENNLGCFTIRYQTAGVVIRSTRFYSHDALGGAVRLGYTFLSPAYWGSGGNQETKEVLLEYAFTIVEKVYFDIGKENFRSRKAVEKLGAVESTDKEDKVVCVLSKDAFSNRAWGVRRADRN